MPPGVSTRNASRAPAALSGKNISPNWQTTASNVQLSNGRLVPSAVRYVASRGPGSRLRAWANIASLRSVAMTLPRPPSRWIRHRDDRGLQHLGMVHDHRLDVDGRDPLAAGLDEVLRAVGDLHVALGIDGCDVARAEPAVGGEAVDRLGIVVVGADDPRPAHLDLAHALAVPRLLDPRVV